MLLKSAQALLSNSAGYLKELVYSHACFSHRFFARLEEAGPGSGRPLNARQAISLLTNYDAHASLLRRLLLRAAASMPEAAVGFVLENVRNEYGNGDYSSCHQGQLKDLIARIAAATPASKSPNAERDGSAAKRPSSFLRPPIQAGTRQYMREIVLYYLPRPGQSWKALGLYAPAIAAGAITATELMAIEEFKALKDAFHTFGLANHTWFDHVNVEVDHSEDSLLLAQYFLEKHDAAISVEFSLNRTLDTNIFLYDGLLAAIDQYDEDSRDEENRYG